jgi:cell division protein FtsA
MENGVALVDFGGGSTSVTIYHDNIMRHYASIPFGGKNVTQDIKGELQITERLAENIKLAFGACMPEKLQSMSEKVLHIMDNNADQDKQVPVKYLSEIITARMEEIIEAVLYEIKQSELAEHLRCGIVITGGAAQTANLGMLINEMSGYKVRIGYPKTEIGDYDVNGTHETSAATILGLIHAAINEGMRSCAVDLYGPSEETIKVEQFEIEDEVEKPEIVDEATPETVEEGEEIVEIEEVEEIEEVYDVEKVNEEKEEKEEKTERWGFMKVVWGKAQKVGSKLNNIIDGFTNPEDNEGEEYAD